MLSWAYPQKARKWKHKKFSTLIEDHDRIYCYVTHHLRKYQTCDWGLTWEEMIKQEKMTLIASISIQLSFSLWYMRLSIDIINVMKIPLLSSRIDNSQTQCFNSRQLQPNLSGIHSLYVRNQTLNRLRQSSKLRNCVICLII